MCILSYVYNSQKWKLNHKGNISTCMYILHFGTSHGKMRWSHEHFISNISCTTCTTFFLVLLFASVHSFSEIYGQGVSIVGNNGYVIHWFMTVPSRLFRNNSFEAEYFSKIIQRRNVRWREFYQQLSFKYFLKSCLKIWILSFQKHYMFRGKLLGRLSGHEWVKL